MVRPVLDRGRRGHRSGHLRGLRRRGVLDPDPSRPRPAVGGADRNLDAAHRPGDLDPDQRRPGRRRWQDRDLARLRRRCGLGRGAAPVPHRRLCIPVHRRGRHQLRTQRDGDARVRAAGPQGRDRDVPRGHCGGRRRNPRAARGRTLPAGHARPFVPREQEEPDPDPPPSGSERTGAVRRPRRHPAPPDAGLVDGQPGCA